jgi:hypothetical protein
MNQPHLRSAWLRSIPMAHRPLQPDKPRPEAMNLGVDKTS